MFELNPYCVCVRRKNLCNGLSCTFFCVWVKDRQKKFCQCFIICYPWNMWPRSDLLIWHATCLYMTDLNENMCNLVISYLWSHMILESFGFARSRDKPKPLYLYCHIAYGHQTWQDGNLPWCDFTHDVAGLFDHLGFSRSRDKLKPVSYPLPQCL